METAHGADRTKLMASRGAFSAPVLAMSSEELFVAAKNVALLKEHPGWVFLQQLFEDRKSRLIAQIVHGSLLEQAEYAAQTAMVSGIEQAQWAVEAVVSFSEQRERELREQGQEEGI